ncbi:glycoside hydrolase family 27 protein [Streptomyces sp. NRRL F-525]|uniref:glycoside hydrolase family 27 protein n=1 Tax=Streptomyces sp. NRRL F-525 TaxID=1463861 RepID=UPI001F28BBE6|nr:glycoside hydrolase family 27 protein [Streptomyces sp. NRRL F-525]
MRRQIRGALAAFTGALLLTMGITATGGHSARADDNGVGLKPVLGWSSWSFVRRDPTARTIEAQAKALKTSGLAKNGFVYANVDDFWYQCPGSQGPDVDQYGRWVTDPVKFPPRGGENGVQVVADYVHSLGLKFGLYVTPGISQQAVAKNTAIEGSPYHARDIATTATESNYNCGGMVGIDYTKPGAQTFIDSWAGQFAGWGIDYLKIDGVGTSDQQDVQAWSDALHHTGRPIHLELSNNLDINNAATWKKLSNGWRTGGDIECYCGPDDSSYPLTTWASIASRFDQVAAWAPYGGPGGYNDYDSLEIGNGANNGLTPDERRTQMSLWSLAASPLILGTDLTRLDPADLALLKNTDVLGVDQDGIDAKRISSDTNSQVFAKTEGDGDVVVGLFNTGPAPREVATTAGALGLRGARDYALRDLWSHRLTESSGRIAANVPAHGVVLYRVHATHRTVTGAAPDVSFGLDWAPAPSDSTTRTVTAVLSDNGSRSITDADLTLTGPAGTKITTRSVTRARAVRGGHALKAVYSASIPPSAKLFASNDFQGTASYRFRSAGRTRLTAGDTITVNHQVTAPYRTFASTTASFSESGSQLGIRAQGADLYNGTNEYGSIYLPGAEHDGSVTTVKLNSQSDTDVWAKAGIMVRNDITQPNTSPGYVALVATPGNGYLLDWDSDGDGKLDSQDSAGTAAYPSWLKLVRDGTSYSGYYSTDNATWNLVGTIDVPTAAATQDVGLTQTSHASGTTGEADFDSFTTTP